MRYPAFKIRCALLPLFLAVLCTLGTGCHLADGLLFPQKEFPAREEAEKQFPAFDLKTGQRVVFLQGKPEYPVILYSYGNAEWIREKRVQTHIGAMQEHGYSVLVYDYSGYGKDAKREATVKNVCEDIEAVYRYLTEDKKFPPSKIIAFGFSVGTGPSCYIASKFPLGGVILVAPFASAAQALFPFPLPFIDEFPNAEYLESCQTPLLLYHGVNDPKVPYRNGLKIYEKAKGPKTMVTVQDMTDIKPDVPGDSDHVKIFKVIQDRFWTDLQSCFSDAHK